MSSDSSNSEYEQPPQQVKLTSRWSEEEDVQFREGNTGSNIGLKYCSSFYRMFDALHGDMKTWYETHPHFLSELEK